MRKTKIVCTLGPATASDDVVRNLILSGMDVARFNFSHGTHEDHNRRLEQLIKIREELNIPVATLCDTKGPEVRLGLFKDKKIHLNKGDIFTLTNRNIEGDENVCSITYHNLPNDVKKGTRILIDDGLIGLKVIDVNETDITCTVLNGGDVSSSKGINVPGIALGIPFLSEKDKNDIRFAAEHGFDFIAASFTQTASNIMEIRNELDKYGCSNIEIIAKIENSEGVGNIDEIIRVSDGVMVARGDLGVEIPLADIPVVQKQIIRKAYFAGKKVITATQMLDSMMKNPRPTRAETSDVANAIYDGTSAIMLSGETAAGLYPVESVKTMANIAERTELDIDYIKRFEKHDMSKCPSVTDAISHATCTTAHDLGAAAIITVTKSGKTGRMISKYRPNCPIISCTPDESVLRRLQLSWGVTPILLEEKTNTDELFQDAVDVAREQGLVKEGDLVVITAGIPLGISGTTNMLKVHLVGNILISGVGLSGKAVSGKLCVCKNEEDARRNFKDGDILVIPQTSNEIMDILKRSTAIITEQGGLDSHGAIVGLTLDKPVLLEAENATKVLKSGTAVTLDAGRGVCFYK